MNNVIDLNKDLTNLEKSRLEKRFELRKIEKDILKIEFQSTKTGEPLRYELLFNNDWVGILFLYLLHVGEDYCSNMAKNFDDAISKRKFIPPEEREKSFKEWNKKYTRKSLYAKFENCLEFMKKEGLVLSRTDPGISSRAQIYTLMPEIFYNGIRRLSYHGEESKTLRTIKFLSSININSEELKHKRQNKPARAEYQLYADSINRNISLILLELIPIATDVKKTTEKEQDYDGVMKVLEQIGKINEYSYTSILLYTLGAIQPLLILLHLYRCYKRIEYGYFNPKISTIGDGINYYQSLHNTLFHEVCVESSVNCRKAVIEAMEKLKTQLKIYNIKLDVDNADITRFNIIDELKEIVQDQVKRTELFLFSWDETPGNHTDKLKEFLRQNYSFEWIPTTEIEKNKNKNTITVRNGKDSLLLKLEEEKNKITLNKKKILFINNMKTDFIVRFIDNKQNIYKKLDPNEDYSAWFYKDKDIDLLKLIEGLTAQSNLLCEILVYYHAGDTGILSIEDFFATFMRVYNL